MDSFSIYTAAHVIENDDEYLQKAGCGVVVVGTIDDKTATREWSFGLGNSSRDVAELQAIRLGLVSMRTKFRHAAIVLYTSHKQAAAVLTGDPVTIKGHAWERTARIIAGWVGYFPKLLVSVAEPVGGYHARALILAQTAAETQSKTDSGTKHGI